jgi:hypothetical protein
LCVVGGLGWLVSFFSFLSFPFFLHSLITNS